MPFARSLLLFLFAIATPAAAQLGLPGVSVPRAGEVLDPLSERLNSLNNEVAQTTDRLLRERERTLSRFLRRNREHVELDARGLPARRGELLVLDMERTQIGLLQEAGFLVSGEERIDGLGLSVTRLFVPEGMDLAQAERRLASILPDATIAPDHLHFQSGPASAFSYSAAAASPRSETAPVGVIDGAPAAALGRFSIRGFADGAPVASHHASAIVYLLRHAGVAITNRKSRSERAKGI